MDPVSSLLSLPPHQAMEDVLAEIEADDFGDDEFDEDMLKLTPASTAPAAPASADTPAPSPDPAKKWAKISGASRSNVAAVAGKSKATSGAASTVILAPPERTRMQKIKLVAYFIIKSGKPQNP